MLTADYSGGSVSVFPIRNGAVGEMSQKLTFNGSGPVKGRQESSHIHQVRHLPSIEGIDDDYILASDLGADVIRVIHADSEEILTHFKDIPCPAGSGPRHMEFSKDGRMLYCLGELSGEVLAYEIAAEKGMPKFTLKQIIMADEVNAGGSADIHLHPSGKWLYTSHRLDNDGIATFSIKADGTLEKTGYNKTARHPRNFMISDDGAFMLVACLNDRIIQVFRISEDGTLTLTPSVLRFEKDMPSCVTVIR
jgi:6-phosphogluconolactonase (cycloisomerase 2 family)